MNRIIALWSHPRSMSTAMERMMRERGDFRCFHEPFMYYYYLHVRERPFPHFDWDTDHPTTYDGIKGMLLDVAEDSPVFFKDMSYYVHADMAGDRAFAERLTNTFLIRDPAKSIVSYYKMDPDVTCEEIGLERQYEHHRLLTDWFGETPLVIDAADVLADPEGMVRAYCTAVGIPFLPEALEWSDETPDDWKGVATWHRGVLASGGIGRKPPQKKGETKPAVTLDSVPHLRAYYEHHRPFYEALREHRLAPAPAG